jgi:hypothetical protein
MVNCPAIEEKSNGSSGHCSIAAAAASSQATMASRSSSVSTASSSLPRNASMRPRMVAAERSDSTMPLSRTSSKALSAAALSRACASERACSRASWRQRGASAMNGAKSRIKARHSFMARRKSCTASWLDRSGSSSAERAPSRMWPPMARTAGPIAARGCKAGLSAISASMEACKTV